MIIKTMPNLRNNEELNAILSALQQRGLVIEWSESIELSERLFERLEVLKVSDPGVENPVHRKMRRLLEILDVRVEKPAQKPTEFDLVAFLRNFDWTMGRAR